MNDTIQKIRALLNTLRSELREANNKLVDVQLYSIDYIERILDGFENKMQG